WVGHSIVEAEVAQSCTWAAEETGIRYPGKREPFFPFDPREKFLEPPARPEPSAGDPRRPLPTNEPRRRPGPSRPRTASPPTISGARPPPFAPQTGDAPATSSAPPPRSRARPRTRRGERSPRARSRVCGPGPSPRRPGEAPTAP